MILILPLVCFLCLSLTVSNLALIYRLIRNKLFGSVFNLHSVFMFLLTAIKTPLSVAIKLTMISGAENYREFSCILRLVMEWIWGGSLLIGIFYAFLFKYKWLSIIKVKNSLPLCRFVRLANAHNDPGPDGLRMFNIGYLADLAGILLAWNSAGIIKATMLDEFTPYRAFCLKRPLESNPSHPNIIGIVVLLSLCFTFSMIIMKITKIYLNKLQDIHLPNLPAKNALTYIDTLIFLSILFASFIIKSFFILLWTLYIFSFDTLNFVNTIISLIVDEVGVGFIFPLYIIMKTKRYLPRLWDDSRQIIAENNDFFSINPATVAPAPGPHPTNQQIAQSSLLKNIYSYRNNKTNFFKYALVF